jgi:hypothetical protein
VANGSVSLLFQSASCVDATTVQERQKNIPTSSNATRKMVEMPEDSDSVFHRSVTGISGLRVEEQVTDSITDIMEQQGCSGTWSTWSGSGRSHCSTNRNNMPEVKVGARYGCGRRMGSGPDSSVPSPVQGRNGEQQWTPREMAMNPHASCSQAVVVLHGGPTEVT